MKVKVSINIDKNVYEKSKQLGVNVSQACTNYLKFLNSQIEVTLTENKTFQTPISLTRKFVAGGEGFEPSTPNLGEVFSGTAEDWQRFRAWVEGQGYRGGYASNIFNYAQRFSDCLFKRDLSKVYELKESLRPNVLKALSALSKFLGCYEDWKVLLKQYGLSWVGRSTDDVIIDRLTRTDNPDEVWDWVRLVKEALPFKDFMDLLAVTGLRFTECVVSYNLSVKLNGEGRLGDYYKVDKEALEHYRFKELFLRNTKKAFVSFVPEDLVKRICLNQVLPDAEYVKKLVQRRHLSLRFGDVREAHGTLMTKYLKESEINFLHGRVSSSVFMQHYFNPSLIGDLKERAFKGIAEILEKTKS
jgi:hypothetical protein